MPVFSRRRLRARAHWSDALVRIVSTLAVFFALFGSVQLGAAKGSRGARAHDNARFDDRRLDIPGPDSVLDGKTPEQRAKEREYRKSLAAWGASDAYSTDFFSASIDRTTAAAASSSARVGVRVKDGRADSRFTEMAAQSRRQQVGRHGQGPPRRQLDGDRALAER
jgi:hypothetical protein